MASRLERVIRTHSLMSDAVRYAPGRVLPAALAIIGTMIFTRVFTPAQYGILTLVNGITGPIIIMTSQSGGQAAQRFFAEYRAEGRGSLYDQTISLLWQYCVAFMVALSIIIILSWGIFGQDPSRFPLILLIGAGVGMTAQVGVSMLTPILPARQHIRSYTNFHMVNALAALVLPLSLVFVLGRQITWMIWGTALSAVVMFPILTTMLRSDMRLRFFRRPTPQIRETMRRFIRYGIPMSVWLLGVSIMNTTDRYVIAWHAGIAATALYSTNYNIAAQLYTLFSIPLLNATWPRVLQTWATTRDPHTVQVQIRQGTQTYLLVGVGVVGAIAVAGNVATRLLLGAAFYPGHVVLIPVMAGYVIWGATMFGHKGLEITERNNVMTILCLVAAAVNVLLNLWLVPEFGWPIAAYATMAAYFTYAATVWWLSRKFIPWDIPWRPLLTYCLGAISGWGIVHGIPSRPTDFILADILRGLAFCIWYMGWVWMGHRSRRI